MLAVIAKFKLTPVTEPAAVKRADDNALANEAYSFFGETEGYKLWTHQFKNGYKQMPFLIKPQPWRKAEFTFLALYTELVNLRNS